MATQLHLRLPPALHDRLKQIADEQGVSLNAAIVLVLASATGVSFRHPLDRPIVNAVKELALQGSHPPTASQVARKVGGNVRIVEARLRQVAAEPLSPVHPIKAESSPEQFDFIQTSGHLEDEWE